MTKSLNLFCLIFLLFAYPVHGKSLTSVKSKARCTASVKSLDNWKQSVQKRLNVSFLDKMSESKLSCLILNDCSVCHVSFMVSDKRLISNIRFDGASNSKALNLLAVGSIMSLNEDRVFEFPPGYREHYMKISTILDRHKSFTKLEVEPVDDLPRQQDLTESHYGNTHETSMPPEIISGRKQHD